MKAIIKPAYKKERIKLGEVLPVSTPYRLTISPSQICNFKCFYCTHSLDKSEVLKTGFKYSIMEYSMFTKLADQLKDFPEKVKLIVFSGMGEPLLNKDFPRMIRYIKENDLADKVDVYTNASLLTKNLTHDLVNSGLDSLKISLQGLDSNKYKDCSDFNLDFEKFIENIKYFYDNRGNCKIYIKIIDASLEDGEEEKFYEIFGDICDEIFIEHLSDCQPLTNDCNGTVDSERTMYNEIAKYSSVCPLLFYTLYVDVECNIYPCVTLGLPNDFSIGNIEKLSLYDMWNGETIKTLRLNHLKGKKDELYVCKDCGNMAAMYHEEDDIDDYSEAIIEKLISNQNC